MITAGQMRAARALRGLDQRALAELSTLSLPTIRGMEAADDAIRGNVDSLTKLVSILSCSSNYAPSLIGGCGVRSANPT